MDKKLIAIDLDGTTLDDYSNITPETYEAIQKVIKKGHIVSIATGRSFRQSSHLYKALDLNTPIVNYNGAWCHNPYDANWIHSYHKKLTLDLAFSLLNLRDEPNIHLIAAETHDTVYVDREPTSYPNDAVPFQLIGAELTPFTKNHLTEDPTSVSVFTPLEKNIPEIEDKIIQRFGNQVEVRTWGGQTPTLEVVSLGIQKALGVERIANYYNIQTKNILAFGDEANDFEMIQYAGHGVVMKNGIDELKEVSDDVTTYSNHENGLAHYLTDYFNL